MQAFAGGYHPHAEVVHPALKPIGSMRLGGLRFTLQAELFHFATEIRAMLFHEDL
jgi:hypothetical protein